MRPVVWLCSGQGAQFFHMGKDIYESDATFRAAMDRCDAIAAPLIGASLTRIVFAPREDRFAPFDNTLHTSPAIVAVQYAMACALRARGLAPDAVLGYSLGEVSAAVIAGAMALEDGLAASIALAQVLQRQVARGGMLAVLAEPALMRARPAVFRDTWLAAHNFDRHFVVSGDAAAIARVESALAAEQVNVARLPVEFAFHCPLIDAVGDQFTAHMAGVAMASPRCAVLSSVRRGGPAVLTAAGIWDVVRQPVPFAEAIAALEARGGADYIDLGPAGTLATFVKYNLAAGSASRTASTITPFGTTLRNLEGELFRPPVPSRAWGYP